MYTEHNTEVFISQHPDLSASLDTRNNSENPVLKRMFQLIHILFTHLLVYTVQIYTEEKQWSFMASCVSCVDIQVFNTQEINSTTKKGVPW